MKNIIFAYRLNKGENPTVSETPYAASNFTLCAFLTEGEYNKRLTELYDQGNENLIKIKGNVPNWEDFVIFKIVTQWKLEVSLMKNITETGCRPPL